MDDRKKLTELTASEIKAVAGGIGPYKPPPVMAEDMYGNKLTPEEYMDFQMALMTRYNKELYPNYGIANNPHDFTSWSKF